MGPFLLLAIVFVLATGGGGGGGASGWNAPSRAGLDELRSLGAQSGLSEIHTAFLSLVAYGESGLNNLRGLGIPDRFPPGTLPTKHAGQLGVSEANAAAAAYRQNARKFANCGHPASAYAFGSGGWFAFLPAYGLAQWPSGSGLRCLPPRSVFDPRASFCMAIGFARGLQNWGGFGRVPTVLNLRGGWGRPSRMGDASRLANIRARYARHAQAIGLPASFVDERIPRFPSINLADLYRQLGGSAPAVATTLADPREQPPVFIDHAEDIGDLYERLEAA